MTTSLPKGSKGEVGVFGELANPSGADPLRVRLGVETERKILGPISTWAAAWGEKQFDDSKNAWGWGAGAGLRMRW